MTRKYSQEIDNPRKPMKTHTNPSKTLVDCHGLAEVLNCSWRHVENLARDGKIECIRLGRLRRYDPDRVLAALNDTAQREESR
jgi:excisionase family DNA binding protein